MKKLLFVILFFSSTVYAGQVTVKKTNCSVMGNLKVKVNGLGLGRMGRKYFKADLPYFEDCDKTEMLFHQAIGRGPNRVSVGIKKTYRKVQSGEGDKTRCKIYEIKILSLRFDKYKKRRFYRSDESLKTKLDGPCPQ